VEPIWLEARLFDKAIKEEFMRMKLLVAAAGFATLATPALAAEFYIVQDTTTKRCTIVEQKPTSQTTVVVGNGTTYTTRQQAEGAMKTVKVCESGGTVGGPVPVPR
jgi:vancomycin permeability regulator SanA